MAAEDVEAARWAAKVAAGELEVAGVDDAGRPVYRAVPDA